MWPAGTVIIQDQTWKTHNGLVIVRPVTVVQDSADQLLLYSHAGATFLHGGIPNRYQMPVAERVRIYLGGAPPLREATVKWHVLTFNPPGVHHAVWLFWHANWEPLGWYVNLQLPYVRTARGMAYEDRVLDLQLTPDFIWSWKDLDEFEVSCEAGLYDAQERQVLLDEAYRMIQAIERRDPPFSAKWLDWRPDPEWPVPHVRGTAENPQLTFTPAVQ